jgi:transketolase
VRRAFITALTEEAARDKRIWLLTGDMGFSVFEDFAALYPDRFLNAGVAEANMTGIAAGLALSGLMPFIYSITPFVTMRCFEQLRIDVCYQNQNVRVIGGGGGLCYGSAGGTHHSLEDISLMRSLPNMSVVCPGDPHEVTAAVRYSLGHSGPMYVRLGRDGDPLVHAGDVILRPGKAITLRDGGDVSLIATGNILGNALKAADELHEQGVSVRLISMPFVKPIDRETILSAVSETKALFTIEEHSLIGGLGSATAEVLAESGKPVRFQRLAIPDRFFKEVGSQEYLRELVGLSPGGIAISVLDALRDLPTRKSQ